MVKYLVLRLKGYYTSRNTYSRFGTWYCHAILSECLFNFFFLHHTGLLSVLSILDIYFVNHAYYSTLTKGASVQLVFGFEVMPVCLLKSQKRPTRKMFVYKIQVNPILTILKYGDYYDFMDS